MRAIRVKAGQEIQCSEEELRAEGIRCERFDLGQLALVVQQVHAEHGWSEVDDVRRSANRPQDEAEVVREADEHCHLEDEVRLLVEGQGLYDIRDREEQWIRIWVRPGDWIAIPARRYHRFLAGQEMDLRYVQPYGHRAALLNLYRVSEDATRAG
jgi:1,2-dihydroxy-3-keto-5-methylthiopentene dioxygenase